MICVSILSFLAVNMQCIAGKCIAKYSSPAPPKSPPPTPTGSLLVANFIDLNSALKNAKGKPIYITADITFPINYYDALVVPDNTTIIGAPQGGMPFIVIQGTFIPYIFKIKNNVKMSLLSLRSTQKAAVRIEGSLDFTTTFTDMEFQRNGNSQNTYTSIDLVSGNLKVS